MRRLRDRGGVLRQRDFRLFWAGETVSDLGNSMATVAIPLVLVTVLHASTFTLGLFTTVAYLPWVLVSLPAGAVIDRLPVRRVMIAMDVAAAAVYGAIPAAAAAHVLTVGLALVIAFLAGVANVVFMNAFQILLPSLVGEGDLVPANAWLSGSSSAAEVAGPGLSGLIAGVLGAAFALLADALSFLVSAACLAGIAARAARGVARAPAAGGPGRTAPGGPAGPGFRRRMTAGLRFIARDPYLRPLALWAATVNLGLGGYDALIVAYLIRDVRVGPGTVGLLITTTSLGSVTAAVTATPLVRRVGSARAVLLTGAGTMPFVLLIPLTGRGAWLLAFVAGRLVALFGIVTMNVISPAFRQSYAPPSMLGMVTAAHRFVVLSAYPLGGLVGGTLGTWLGVRASLWTSLAIVSCAGTALLASPIRGRRDLPRARAPAG